MDIVDVWVGEGDGWVVMRWWVMVVVDGGGVVLVKVVIVVVGVEVVDGKVESWGMMGVGVNGVYGGVGDEGLGIVGGLMMVIDWEEVEVEVGDV